MSDAAKSADGTMSDADGRTTNSHWSSGHSDGSNGDGCGGSENWSRGNNSSDSLTAGNNGVDLLEHRSDFLLDGSVGLNDFSDFLDDRSADGVDDAVRLVFRVGLLDGTRLAGNMDLVNEHWAGLGHESDSNWQINGIDFDLSQLSGVLLGGHGNHFVCSSAMDSCRDDSVGADTIGSSTGQTETETLGKANAGQANATITKTATITQTASITEAQTASAHMDGSTED